LLLHALVVAHLQRFCSALNSVLRFLICHLRALLLLLLERLPGVGFPSASHHCPASPTSLFPPGTCLDRHPRTCLRVRRASPGALRSLLLLLLLSLIGRGNQSIVILQLDARFAQTPLPPRGRHFRASIHRVWFPSSLGVTVGVTVAVALTVAALVVAQQHPVPRVLLFSYTLDFS